MTRFDSRRRRARLAALVVFGSVCLVLAALAGGAAVGSAAAGSSGSAPTAESSPSSPAVAVSGSSLSATTSPRPQLLTAGLTAVAVGLAAIVVRTGSGPAGGTRRHRRVGLVLGDVGDRWRALLIGAPPSSLSF